MNKRYHFPTLQRVPPCIQTLIIHWNNATIKNNLRVVLALFLYNYISDLYKENFCYKFYTIYSFDVAATTTLCIFNE